MKLKTSELTGAALDWAVAKCEGYTGEALKERSDGIWYTPSTDWAQGGPIIERECIQVSCIGMTGYTPNVWTARSPKPHTKPYAKGPTPLIAAMRCYVASKLGDEIEIPEELK